jgi:hypothetical protein
MPDARLVISTPSAMPARMLGVVAAIECVDALNRAGTRLRSPSGRRVCRREARSARRCSASRVAGASIEGSRCRRSGRTVDARRDEGCGTRGRTRRRCGAAARRHARLCGLHIEQGRCSNHWRTAGVVTAINGGNRFIVDIGGMAGHAGAVPMRCG